MALRSRITEISEILDEHIEKGLSREKTSKIERLEKALSHDPFQPVNMGWDSPYYSPYRIAPEGGFLPYSADHWAEQGYERSAYLTTENFYQKYGGSKVDDAIKEFRGFSKFLAKGDLVKAGVVPVGTVHTYADGKKYKKIDNNSWAPVVSKENKRFLDGIQAKDPKAREESNKMLDQHAAKHSKIKDHISKKEQELKVIEETTKHVTKQVMGHLKQALGHLFDGDMPPEMNQIFESAEKQAKITPKHHLKDLSQNMSAGRTHNVHVRFKLNGAPYDHTFPAVQGTTAMDAQERVVSALKKQFGEGITLDKLSIRPDEKVKGKDPKEKQGKEAKLPETTKYAESL